jgi:hypothetical protein
VARFFAWGHRPARWPVSVVHLWPLTVLLGIFAFLNTHPIRPHDFWWHMAVGREILATGHIPTVDTFSFTAAGTPYPSYAAFWLPEVVLYGLYTLGGPALVVFVHSLTVTTAYGLTTRSGLAHLRKPPHRGGGHPLRRRAGDQRLERPSAGVHLFPGTLVPVGHSRNPP